MSSSKPCKSRSGSVQDSDSESSIEYIQTQSPMSPNTPLTIPIVSSMNVSGLNIDVRNLNAPTSSTWSIPNISCNPIPLNPTKRQIHVSEGPGSTPEISPKANPQKNFHVTSSLILVGIHLRPRNSLGKVNSQPSILHQDLRLMWGMISRLVGGNEKTIGKSYSEWSVRGKTRIYAS
ncbi:hypothetical protein O181_037973 [Austropuccinia psidii MF-1]|uniref:Uncharacterized protein n=1 Tax=Austropuccinia psidii MF-1 TaxID=1389203 RepID=A0A9Q3DAJ0_9BASI|nr:hypothetical protein [Austropuccinia psidii MF-1]